MLSMPVTGKCAFGDSSDALLAGNDIRALKRIVFSKLRRDTYIPHNPSVN